MSFANSFWSRDYSNGLKALYSKLDQGCVENSEVLALAQARAEIEEAYGYRLRDIKSTFAPKKNGFDKDDGASMRQAYVGIIEEMSHEGQHHIQVANNIRQMVIEPFGAWSDEHASRVEYSRQATESKVKEYERHMAEVNKAQKRYFNKCRVLEELREKEYESDSDSNSSTAPSEANDSSANPPIEEVTSQELTLAGTHYTDKDAQALIAQMLKEIPKKDHKVPILGVYSNCSTGSDIVQWIQLQITGDITKVEAIGQDMVDNGLLRLIGQVGSKFANSSVMMYQWRPRAYEIAGISFSTGVVDSIIGSSIGESLQERWQDYYRGSDQAPETRLAREVRDLDQKYRKAVVILDNTRSQLEELLFDHFKFMNQCESDRLKALKAVVLDLVASQSNVVPSIQASVDKQLVLQESMNPATDLRFIIESYRTGPMIPQVTIYDNYYSSSDGTIFGMDLELRARGDGKPVPYIVSTILGHLDKMYPVMENDEVRIACWTEQAPLADVNRLRHELNLNVNFDKAILEKYEPKVVVSTLGMYLFQLPESVLPGQYYDLLKAIYSKPAGEARRTALQNLLSQLRLSNIATLDVVTAHVNRLVSIAKTEKESLDKITTLLSKYLLVPQEHTPHTLNDSFGGSVVMDLVENRQIFKELRKNAQPRRETSVRSESRRTSSSSSSKVSTKSKVTPKVQEQDKETSSSVEHAQATSKQPRESVADRVSRIASMASPRTSSKPSTPKLNLSTFSNAPSGVKVELSEEPFKSPMTPKTAQSLASQLDELASEAEAFQDAPDSWEK